MFFFPNWVAESEYHSVLAENLYLGRCKALKILISNKFPILLYGHEQSGGGAVCRDNQRGVSDGG